MPSYKSVLSAFAVLASTNAHMLMATPPPYGSPNNSPLDPSGSDFPCKSTSSSGAPVTNMAIGQKQSLSFTGSAVHGGGSCQVSLTTDNPAKKDSKWMVIHSIEGGCPARGVSGNAGDDPHAKAADTYDFSIPQGIAPGAYTLAWTWFNKIGNREMYMNCASVKVTGGTAKREATTNTTEEYSIPELSERATPNFPSMFMANIAPSTCKTAEGGSVQFPDPGTSVETNAGPFSAPVGADCGKAGAQPASPAAPSGGASSPASPSGAPDSNAAANGSAPNAASAIPPVLAASAAPAAPSMPAVPAAPAAPTGAGSSTCTQSGQSICSPDQKQIGTCDATKKVTWIPVAAGTKCSGGLMVLANSKRSAKFRLM